jgi:tRNA U34 5-carboxymethylaminomethyl modifying enzyme MnmG/GidA
MDRLLYKLQVQHLLSKVPNLHFMAGEVDDLLIETTGDAGKPICCGLVLGTCCKLPFQEFV